APFPIQNLPYGIFHPRSGGTPRPRVASGDFVPDPAGPGAEGLFPHPPLRQARPFAQPSLSRFFSLGREAWKAARAKISHLLRADVPRLRDDAELRAAAFHRMQDVTLLLPAEIGDYADFYSSKEHATNVGTMF